jgi:hypothetical protein
MMIRSLAIMLVLCASASAQTADELRAHVTYLASDDLEGRQSGSEGMALAIDYVKDECRKLDLPVYSQKVKVRGGTCLNTIAVLEGRTDTRIVLGAHLDGIGRGRRGINNGADDNASGSGALLGLAARLAAGPMPNCTIEFHWYTGEEQGLLGSKQYTRKPLVPIAQYKFMLNLDMIGKLERKRLIGGGDDFPYQAELNEMYAKYRFAKRTTWASDTVDSDHSSWWRAGVPAVILHTGLHPDYHGPGDDADKLNYEGMADMCRYALDLTRAIDRRLAPAPEPSPFLY